MKKNIGGQAIIEGILLRDNQYYTIAVRDKNDNIFTLSKKETLSIDGFNFPFLRGIFSFFYSVWIGLKAVGLSASIQQGDGVPKINKQELITSFIISMLLALGLFFVIPISIASITNATGVKFNFIEGIVRVGIFLFYIIVIAQLESVKRLFSYHGAEHKVINAYEKGLRLTIENVRKQSRFHPRCGTSFMIFFFILSIMIFSVIRTDYIIAKIALRLILLPIIAGITYEIIRLFSIIPEKYQYLFNIGIFLQYLTTNEPDNKQLEVAINALKELLKNEAIQTN